MIVHCGDISLSPPKDSVIFYSQLHDLLLTEKEKQRPFIRESISNFRVLTITTVTKDKTEQLHSIMFTYWCLFEESLIPSCEFEISSRATLTFFRSISKNSEYFPQLALFRACPCCNNLPPSSTALLNFSAARRFSASSFFRALSWRSCVYSWLGRESIRMSMSWAVLAMSVENSAPLSLSACR